MFLSFFQTLRGERKSLNILFMEAQGGEGRSTITNIHQALFQRHSCTAWLHSATFAIFCDMIGGAMAGELVLCNPYFQRSSYRPQHMLSLQGKSCAVCENLGLGVILSLVALPSVSGVEELLRPSLDVLSRALGLIATTRYKSDPRLQSAPPDDVSAKLTAYPHFPLNAADKIDLTDEAFLFHLCAQATLNVVHIFQKKLLQTSSGTSSCPNVVLSPQTCSGLECWVVSRQGAYYLPAVVVLQQLVARITYHVFCDSSNNSIWTNIYGSAAFSPGTERFNAILRQQLMFMALWCYIWRPLYEPTSGPSESQVIVIAATYAGIDLKKNSLPLHKYFADYLDARGLSTLVPALSTDVINKKVQRVCEVINLKTYEQKASLIDSDDDNDAEEEEEEEEEVEASESVAASTRPFTLGSVRELLIEYLRPMNGGK
jgi:hypothetical protein